MRTLAFRAGLEALYFSAAFRVPLLPVRDVGIVFTLHHVREPQSGAFVPNRALELTPQSLEMAIELVRDAGFECVSIEDVGRRLKTPNAGRFACFTLDDGYRNNREIAAPIFRRHGVPFAVFVTSGFMTRHAVVWWSVLEAIIGARPSVWITTKGELRAVPCLTLRQKQRLAARLMPVLRTMNAHDAEAWIREFAEANEFDPLEPTRRDMLDVKELRDLAGDPLVTIGAHTRSHANLKTLSDDDCFAEICGGADDLEAILGKRPTVFSYPYGSDRAAGTREFAMAQRAGFDLAFTTTPGLVEADRSAERFSLPRISLNGNFQARRHFEVLVSGVPAILSDRLRRAI